MAEDDAKSTGPGELPADVDIAVLAADVRRTLSFRDYEAPADPRGTLSGDARGTLSGDARGTLSGDARGTLSGDPKGTLSGGTLSGAAAPPGAGPDEGLSAAEFEIDREVGRGGMGIIWAATQRSLDRKVAVKTLRSELSSGPAARHFEFEALVTGRLEHPNIPPVHSYGRDDEGRPFMCMKLVKGVEWGRLLAPKTLEEQERASTIDLAGHLKIIQRVCEAVAFAHANGFIHRDLKPENIMVGEFGEVQVMDWGIALDLSKREESEAQPRGPRRPVGTPAYLPPEMAAADESRMGPWTDVYLVGGLLYELLTGTPPHKGESVLEVLLDAQSGVVEPPEVRAPEKKIPEGLSEITMRALAADPAKRFQSPMEIAHAIDEYLRNESSRELARSATAGLERVEKAVADGSSTPPEIYSAFTSCIAEYEQAVRLWLGNRAARAGAIRARLRYAEFAIDHGDLAIAEAQLNDVPASDPAGQALRARIAAARARIEREARRRKRVVGLLGLLAVAVVAATGLVIHQMRRANVAEIQKARRAKAVAMAQGQVWNSPTERIEVYERALAIDDTWADGYAELGRAYIERAYEYYETDPARGTEDLERAVAPFDRAVALDPKSAVSVADRAYLHEMRGGLSLALRDYAKAVELDPRSHPGCEGAGVIAAAERRFGDAETAATRAIEVEAGETDYFRRGLARYALGKLDEALADLQQAERMSRRDEWYNAALALILLGMGREEEAAEKLVAGIVIHPHPPHGLPLLAYLAAKHGDLERARALEAWAKKTQQAYAACFLAIEPSWRAAAYAPPPYDEVGKALLLELDLSKVVPAEEPPSLKLRREGEARWRRGDAEGALAAAQRALADDPADGGARLLRAECFLALGHLAAAKADLVLAERLAPNRANEARAVLAKLSAREGGAPK